MRTVRYEIKAKLGEGGVGAVYRAWDHTLERNVALKRMLSDSSANSQRLQSELLREASLLASLQHPNVCQVYDFGVDADGAFVVMEFVNGETLELTAQRKADLSEFTNISEQILEGLIAAHSKNILHRDLKPSNVMLNWQMGGKCLVKVLDFGLAKFSATPVRQTVDQETRSTRGSIFFMAPEQFEQRPLDARTDLYSLGCLLYYLLTNRHPFAGRTMAEVMQRHLGHEIVTPLDSLRPDLPAPVVQWVGWMMNRNMEDRPSSAYDALTVLKDILVPAPLIPAVPLATAYEAAAVPPVSTATLSTPPRLRQKRPFPHKLVASLVAAALVGLGLFFFTKKETKVAAIAPTIDKIPTAPQDTPILVLNAAKGLRQKSGTVEILTTGSIDHWTDQAAYAGANDAFYYDFPSEALNRNREPFLERIKRPGFVGAHQLVRFQNDDTLIIGRATKSFSVPSLSSHFQSGALTLICAFGLDPEAQGPLGLLSLSNTQLDGILWLVIENQQLKLGLNSPDLDSARSVIDLPGRKDGFWILILTLSPEHRAPSHLTILPLGKSANSMELALPPLPRSTEEIRIGSVKFRNSFHFFSGWIRYLELSDHLYTPEGLRKSEELILDDLTKE